MNYFISEVFNITNAYPSWNVQSSIHMLINLNLNVPQSKLKVILQCELNFITLQIDIYSSVQKT